MKPTNIIVIIALVLGGCVGLSRVCVAAPKAETRVAANIQYPESVLELFTSQGCSSCPKANAFTRSFATEPDVLTLSYSVDYWDYLGWKDTFGKPEFAARQRSYGQQFQGQVYTPQIVLNGAAHGASFSKAQVRRAVLPTTRPKITFQKMDDGLRVSVNAQESRASLMVMAVRYKHGEQIIPVTKGENKGRNIRLFNVVVDCQNIQEGGLIAAPKKGEAVAILLQDYKGGPIVSAAVYTK